MLVLWCYVWFVMLGVCYLLVVAFEVCVLIALIYLVVGVVFCLVRCCLLIVSLGFIVIGFVWLF